MADGDGSTFDKAESFARRALERLGAKVDKKLGSEEQRGLTQSQIAEIITKLERSIESDLKKTTDGGHIAPNRFQVLFTYESGLTPAYMSALGEELRRALFDYITNRRYQTSGGIRVEVGTDVFAKSLEIRPSFEAAEGPNSAAIEPSPGSRAITLRMPGGFSRRVELDSTRASISIGRSAENSIHIDDPSISRLHCSVTLRGAGEVALSDLGSSNGTFVGNRRLAEGEVRALEAGDVIRLGDVEMIVITIE